MELLYEANIIEALRVSWKETQKRAPANERQSECARASREAIRIGREALLGRKTLPKHVFFKPVGKKG